ncbi:HAD family hydrolase [Marinobacter sp. R17]|uniref:HAD-IA family hydrolase n=1 Tax=Marinobacter sp. R17 TaxID=2484250 RepID=UPI000F4C174D|nr:HAD-IA family hydrolase [Marinobacter sp. R17]ROU00720.1 HAD family hydrolase [Marinobacter sp. R17]
MASINLPENRFAALLFDMDGTILSSIASAERVWADWAREQGLDVEAFLPTIHGIQAVETIRCLGLPGVDPVVEAERITRAEIENVQDVEAIAGVAAFLEGLPDERWAIVTSAPRALAERRIAAAGLPLPAVLITAEDVARSKPAPDGYLLAAEQLEVDANDCLVFEDAPAGIESGLSAGARVVVVTATHNHASGGAHPAIESYHGLQAVSEASGIAVLGITVSG